MFRERDRPEPPPPIPESAMTPGALAVLGFAKAEAAALNHHYLATEHILLGLMREASSDAARILTSHADLASVRARVEELTGVGPYATGEDLQLTRRAAKVLHLALREAEMYGQKHITPEHLLLGLLREGEGLATQVLLALGVDIWTIRAEASRSLGPPEVRPGVPPPDEPPEG